MFLDFGVLGRRYSCGCHLWWPVARSGSRPVVSWTVAVASDRLVLGVSSLPILAVGVNSCLAYLHRRLHNPWQVRPCPCTVLPLPSAFTLPPRRQLTRERPTLLKPWYSAYSHVITFRGVDGAQADWPFTTTSNYNLYSLIKLKL